MRTSFGRHALAATLMLLLTACQTTPGPGEGSGTPSPDETERATTLEEMTPVALTVTGTLAKRITVGYRSPYRVTVTEPASVEAVAVATGEAALAPIELEIRGLEASLEDHLDQTVRLHGRYVVQPGSAAEPGSEAESRFVDGMIPTLIYLEVERIEVPGL